MKENVIKVPKGIRFISNWSEYSLENFQFPHILDKKMTGCGYTEYCLRNDIDIILCSPRRVLLENKKKHHPEENVYYFRNNLEKTVDFDKEKGKIPEAEKKSKSVDVENLKNTIIDLYYKTRDKHNCKILVTYDSFRLVKEALSSIGVFHEFYTVIDEFQSILVDSHFKSSTELEFMNHLRGVSKVCYVSATPLMKDYLEMMDEFKDLPYFELDWKTEDTNRVINPEVTIKDCNSVITVASKIIKDYLNGKFEKAAMLGTDGKIKEVVSNEAVIYVNSVKNICELIKKNGLTLDNCNVICSKTESNQKKVSKAFGVSNSIDCIGTVPEENEPNKMFTLCTRTVYLGADFYSKCARSFVFSDANIDCLSVDITLDLQQILGRQRTDENPWRNRVELYAKTILYKNKQAISDFSAYLEEKKNKTDRLLNIYTKASSEERKDLIEKYQRDIPVTNYQYDYVAINEHGGADIFPITNNLVMLSELRTFQIQQIDFADSCSLFSSVSSIVEVGDDTTSKLAKVINSEPNFIEKMRYICESELTGSQIQRLLKQIPIALGNYYNILGPEKCKALMYQKGLLKAEYDRLFNNQGIDINSIIYSEFNINEKYLKSDIKSRLGKIYSDAGYKSTPKATDLENYFIIKRCKITNKETKKQEEAFEIISRKEVDL